MTVEFRCSHCGKLLRVSAENAGKQARCPACEGVTTIPHSGTLDAESQPPSDDFTASPSIPHQGVDAGEPSPFAAANSNAYRSPALESGKPSFTSSRGGRSEQAGLVLALGIISTVSSVISLAGICCCLLGIPGAVIALSTGIPAWMLGAGELKRYASGELGPDGRSELQTGMVCGIIGCSLTGLYFVMFVLGILLNFGLSGLGMFKNI